MQNKYFIISFVLMSIHSIGILAQEELKKDVKVVREYSPTVSDAYKVSRLPEVKDSTVTKPSFNYRILSTSVSTDYEPTLISPAKIRTKKKPDLMKSYLKGGLGTYQTLLGELGYNILESDEFVLGLNIGHTSSFGNLNLENDRTVDAPFHDTYAQLGMKYFFDDKTFSADMNFLHNTYKYYGFQTLEMESAYESTDLSNSVLGSELMPEDKQRLSSFDIGIGLKNNVTDEGKTLYDANFNFSTFGNLTGVRQNDVKVSADLSYPINDLVFKLGVGIESYKTSVPDSIGPMFTFNDRSLTYFYANPSVNFNLDMLKLKVGMKLAGNVDTEEDRFFVAPDIRADLTVVEGIVSIYGGLDGQMNLNDYKSVLYNNPFVSPDVNVKSSIYGLRLLGGVKGNFSAKTSFALGMDYSLFNDEHFFVNKYYNSVSTDTGLEIDRQYSNMFVPVYDDGSLLRIKGELLYQPKNDLNILLFGVYNGWSLDNEEAAWHKPEVEFGARGHWAFNEYLSFKGAVSYLGQRMAYDENYENQQKPLKGVIDINVGAEYKYTSHWTFWANIDNLAASKYYQWNGYPTQRFNAMVGVVYSF